MAGRNLLHGANCSISAGDGSFFPCLVTEVNHGISIVSNEGMARASRTVYYIRRTSGSFGMVVQWPSYETSLLFNKWYLAYIQNLANPYLVTTKYKLRVRIPKYKFDRTCVPSGERGANVVFGAAYNDVAYTQTLNFESSTDALELDGPLLSDYEAARNDGETSKYFYPSGTQLRGSEVPRPGTGTDIHDRRLL